MINYELKITNYESMLINAIEHTQMVVSLKRSFLRSKKRGNVIFNQ